MKPDRQTSRAKIGRLLVAAALLVPLAACLNVAESKSQLFKYGAVTIRANSGGTASLLNASAQAVFFEAYSASVPESRAVVNNCQIVPVDTSTTSSKGNIRAGIALALETGAGGAKTTTSLVYNASDASYVGASPFSYTSGDSATIVVPGDATGFAASNVTVRLAEPIVLEDLIVPPADAPMAIRWNAGGDGTSAIILSIKYSNPASTPFPNEQILCSLVDDGAEDIAPSTVAPLLLSPVASRSARITRYRTAAVNPTTLSLLHIVSRVDSTAKLK